MNFYNDYMIHQYALSCVLYNDDYLFGNFVDLVKKGNIFIKNFEYITDKFIEFINNEIHGFNHCLDCVKGKL